MAHAAWTFVMNAMVNMVKKSTFNWTLLFWIATSFIVSSIIYLVGSFVWTLPIVIVAFVGVVVAIRAYNKKKNR